MQQRKTPVFRSINILIVVEKTRNFFFATGYNARLFESKNIDRRGEAARHFRQLITRQIMTRKCGLPTHSLICCCSQWRRRGSSSISFLSSPSFALARIFLKNDDSKIHILPAVAVTPTKGTFCFYLFIV